MAAQGPRVERALVSVSDKTGLEEFGSALAAAGVQIYSTGGTRRFLEEHGLTVHDVAAYTGFPEMLEGRLKTLHPKVFGGILGRRDREDDLQSLAEHGIVPFELVVVNLYPFEQTVASPGVTHEEAVEQIDIGGPSLIRAAAKNHAHVTIATRPVQYQPILAELQAHGCTTLDLRRRLAGEAYARTAAYDEAIAAYFAGVNDDEGDFPPTIMLPLHRQAVLRYGENPHQRGAVYAWAGDTIEGVVGARKRHGKELSYNNLLDLDSALAIVRAFDAPAAAVIKHNNPCGAARRDELADALQAALDGDPLSAFGGVLAMNREVDRAAAEVLVEPGLFIEAIAAPAFSEEAFELLTTRPKWKVNVRLLETGPLAPLSARRDYRQIDGGMLVQDSDLGRDDEAEWQVVTAAKIDDELRAEIRFAWELVRHVRSNAIVLTRDGQLLGAGAGQMSRVDSVEIAIRKAGDRSPGSVLASDAFFPFPDSIEAAAAAGVRAVVQPGGSMRDREVIEACNRHGIAMLLTGRRHFKH